MAIFNAFLNLSELKELYSGKPVCVCPLYNGVLNTPKTFEAAGNPITIPEYKSLVKLTTSFSPKQAGTGDPSPENVRPISGYDSVAVNVRGKNLVNIPNINADTPETDIEVYIPFSLTVSANYDDVTLLESVWRIRFQLQNGNYEYALDGKLPFTVTATPDNPITVIKYRGVRIESGEITEIQLELGSTPTPYEPYQPGTTATLTLPETIYGGTADAVTGEGSKTWGYIASYNGESLPGEWISDRDVYTPGTAPTTGAQVAYKLATPEYFKVSQVSIPSLKGENYFFTNGENMDIIYKKESFWSDEA